MRIQPKVNVRIYTDTARKSPMLALDDAAAERVLDAYDEVSQGQALVEEGDSFVVPKGSIGVPAGFMLRVSDDFDLSIDGGALIHVKKPLLSGTTKAAEAALYMDASFTSLTITLPEGTTTAEVLYAVWGAE